RTVFPERDGVPRQEILAGGGPRGFFRGGGGGGGLSALFSAARGAFYFWCGVAFWGALFVFCAGEDVVFLFVPHLAGDGWSLAPLARDLSASYAARCAGRAAELLPLCVQYADYTLWQRGLLGEESDAGSALGRSLSFWRERLAGLPEQIGLPFDRVRPA